MAYSCTKPSSPPSDVELATAWADMTLFITKNTLGNSPTYASRCLGYVGLTMYETVVPTAPNYQSLAGQLSKLGRSGGPALLKPDQPIHAALALNAGQARILKHLYNQTSDANKQTIDSLEQAMQVRYEAVDNAQRTRSLSFGRAVADQIFAWSKSDGGHRGYLKNFDKKMTYPAHLGCWKPPLYAQSFSHFPLHPHWGKNRTFLLPNAQIPAPAFIKCDTNARSTYFAQFRQVYDKERSLTMAEKECAIWWSDDPDETFTPPGHSYHLATLTIRQKQPPLIRCAETYARVGIAVADAFIDCWKWKYQFFTERPNTFIPKHIDPLWESFWPEPPFPAFPSGHAIQAAAAATVMIDLYGDSISLTDSSHVPRKRDRLRDVAFRPRSFTSFSQLAQEIADSRFYGGIHTPQDNLAGLEKGRTIGANVNALMWRRAVAEKR